MVATYRWVWDVHDHPASARVVWDNDNDMVDSFYAEWITFDIA